MRGLRPLNSAPGERIHPERRRRLLGTAKAAAGCHSRGRNHEGRRWHDPDAPMLGIQGLLSLSRQHENTCGWDSGLDVNLRACPGSGQRAKRGRGGGGVR